MPDAVLLLLTHAVDLALSVTGSLDLTWAVDSQPEDEDVVAGWTAFAIFGALALAVVVLGFSLTKRLKNVAGAAERGVYDPSDPKPERQARGLAAARELREQAARDEADRAGRPTDRRTDRRTD